MSLVYADMVFTWLLHDGTHVDETAHHVEAGKGTGGAGGGRAGELPPPLLGQSACAHKTKLLHALVTAEPRAAHVVALEMADVLIDGQYDRYVVILVAVEPALEAHVASLVSIETPLTTAEHDVTSIADWEHHHPGGWAGDGERSGGGGGDGEG